MSSIRLPSLQDNYQALIGIFVILAFYTNLAVFMDNNSSHGLPTSYWRYLLYGMLLILLLLKISGGEPILPKAMPPLFVWTILYLVTTLASFFITTQDPDVLHLLAFRFQSMVFLVSCFLVFVNGNFIRFFRKWIAIGTIFGVLMNLLEFSQSSILPGLHFGRFTGRAAGLYQDPNMSAIALILGMLLSIDVISPKWRPTYSLLTLAGVLTTFSRSGVVLCVMVIFLMFWTRQLALKPFAITLILAVTCGSLLIASVPSFLVKVETKIDDNADVLNRVKFGVQDSSAKERLELAKHAWEQYSEAPIFGHGVGSTRFWDERVSSHNIFLNLMSDYGFIGIFLMPGLLWTIGRKRRESYVFAFIIFCWGFYNHNLLDGTYILMCFAFEGAVSFDFKLRSQEASEEHFRSGEIFEKAMVLST
jgi:hypothetical protein